MKSLKILNVIGCRPNFVKIAPLILEMKRHAQIWPFLVHTGQHYDEVMSDVFFRDLAIPQPDVSLRVGSGSPPQQLALVMQGLEKVLRDINPDLVLVVGDVNSTAASSLTAITLGYPVAHVEAGLRSFDREMPEEINRVLTDAISDILFATERSAVENLLHEGKPREQVFFVGNVMIDTLVMNADNIARSTVLRDLRLTPKTYALVTLHRPSNVDDPSSLARITGAPILPLAFSAYPAWRLRSWDEFLIPKPFARGAVCFGPPLLVPPRADRSQQEALRKELEVQLSQVTWRADALVRET